MDNQIINPITHQFMHIFTPDVISLLKLYTVEELLNQPRFKPRPSLTTVDDLDYKIISYLNIKDIRTLASINHYTYNQLQSKEYWMNKLKNKKIYPLLPSIKCKNWIKYYKTVEQLKEILGWLNVESSIKYAVNSYAYVNELLKRLNISLYVSHSKFKIWKKDCYGDVYASSDTYVINTLLTHDKISTAQLVSLLFDLYYNNIITTIKIKD